MIILQTPRRLVLCHPQPLWVGGLAYSGFSRKWVGLKGGDLEVASSLLSHFIFQVTPGCSPEALR